MANFNKYMDGIDFSEIIKLFLEKGKWQEMKKKDYFVRQNETSKFGAFVESGSLRYTRVGTDGKEHIVGYCFTNEFVCDYPSFINQSPALVSIQAMGDCVLYVISYKELMSYWETDMNAQRLGRHLAEDLLKQVYERLLDFYCDTPDERYKKLMARSSDLQNQISLREIASFIGVTPETISHIRKKLLQV